MILKFLVNFMGGNFDETLSYIVVDIIFVARGTQLDGHKCLSSFMKKRIRHHVSSFDAGRRDKNHEKALLIYLPSMSYIHIICNMYLIMFYTGSSLTLAKMLRADKRKQQAKMHQKKLLTIIK